MVDNVKQGLSFAGPDATCGAAGRNPRLKKNNKQAPDIIANCQKSSQNPVLVLTAKSISNLF